MQFEEWLLVGAAFLISSVLAWKVSTKLGIPALLLFLGIGMLAGSDGPGGLYFDNAALTQGIGVIALAFILFAGGLETDWKAVRPALGGALSLSTVGVFLTALIVAGFAMLILRFTFLEGLLLGAIISATDAAAVFNVLGAKQLNLSGKLTPMLELESGSNDPMAVFLTIGITHLILDSRASVGSVLLLFVQQMGIGTVAGIALGWAASQAVKKLHLEDDGLYPVLTIAIVLLTYGLTAWIEGSGFLAVYLAGIILGNSSTHRVSWLTRFHSALSWLMQIVMFILLGLLVFPSHLPPVVVDGLLITAAAIFIARPLSVLAALLPVKMPMREKVFISWVGLRGAVPIILATFPLLAGLPKASYIFNLVFFIVFASLLLQGASVPLVAKWLGVVEDN